MLKRKIMFGAAVLVLSLALSYAFAVNGTANLGGTSDPVVTRSYVDAEIAKMRAEILAAVPQSFSCDCDKDAWILETLLRVDSLFAGNFVNTGFEPIFIQAGQVLIGDMGTEIILRSGTAVAHSESAAGGVTNVTVGADMQSGDRVTHNHLLIVPRGDGRGLIAMTDIWVMIKGGYKID
jgi:hypothetical protein